MKSDSGIPNKFLIVGAAAVAGVLIGLVLILSGGESRDSTDPSNPEISTVDPSSQPDPLTMDGSRTVDIEESEVTEWIQGAGSGDGENFSELMNKAFAIRDPALRTQVIAEITSRWIDADADEFLIFLDEMEDADDFGDREWALLAPGLKEALPKVGDEAASSFAFEEVIERLVENLAYQNPPEALEWSREWLLEESLQAALATIAPELAITNPEEAKALLPEITNPMLRLDAISGLGYVLGESQPAEALAWANSLEDPAERAEATGGVLEAMSEEDPAGAAREFATAFQTLTAAGATEPDTLDSLSIAASVIAAEWALQNPQDALNWIETLPEGSMREEAVESIFMEWGEADPEAAFNAYSARTDRSQVLAEVLFESWAITDPDQAAQAVFRVTDPEERQGALGGVVLGWIYNEPEPDRVLEWVGTLQNDADRDTATEILVEELTFDYPELAWRQSQTIRDTTMRTSAMREAFMSLVDSNPEAARNALDSMQGTPEQMNEFRAILDASQP